MNMARCALLGPVRRPRTSTGSNPCKCEDKFNSRTSLSHFSNCLTILLLVVFLFFFLIYWYFCIRFINSMQSDCVHNNAAYLEVLGSGLGCCCWLLWWQWGPPESAIEQRNTKDEDKMRWSSSTLYQPIVVIKCSKSGRKLDNSVLVTRDAPSGRKANKWFWLTTSRQWWEERVDLCFESSFAATCNQPGKIGLSVNATMLHKETMIKVCTITGF